MPAVLLILLLALALVPAPGGGAANAQPTPGAAIDYRFVLDEVDCEKREARVHIEIRSSTLIFLADQNYRFSFGTEAVPEIDPPVTTGNPPDRSVFIEANLILDLFPGLNFYSSQTLAGSSLNSVSANVTYGGLNPAFATQVNATWLPILRLRMNIADLGATLNLTWNTGSDLPPTIVQETVAENESHDVPDGTYENFSFSLAGPCSIVDVPLGQVPRTYLLGDASPNPFNPLTSIAFELPTAEAVRLAVFDLAGRTVTTLVDEPLVSGRHHVQWDGRDASGQPVASGVYVYKLEAGDFSQSRRMALLK